VALATVMLLIAGGLVTSPVVGMAVPDWPNSYGYNMFFFPVSLVPGAFACVISARAPLFAGRLSSSADLAARKRLVLLWDL
jgi:hypothetical protein